MTTEREQKEKIKEGKQKEPADCLTFLSCPPSSSGRRGRGGLEGGELQG